VSGVEHERVPQPDDGVGSITPARLLAVRVLGQLAAIGDSKDDGAGSADPVAADEPLAWQVGATVDDPRWLPVWRLAARRNDYDLRGGFRAVADIAHRVSRDWHQTGQLPSDVDEVRTALFFAARACRWSERDPSPREAPYVLALYDAVLRAQ
jgi:hypothetical protein